MLEAINLVAENCDIRANPKGKVIGTVIEAEVDRSKGVMATLLVQNGTLQVGDVIVAGDSHGKLKAMFDFNGKPVRKAGPSTPVYVMGLNNVPQAGDIFQVVDSEKGGRALIYERTQAKLSENEEVKKAVTLEQLFDRFQAGEIRELKLIVKADVQGSLEPIVTSLNDLGTGELAINILHAETGNIGENDVMLASASNAIIIGFNVQAEVAARKLAEAEGVSIRQYEIIYRLIEDVEKALQGMLEPEEKQVVIGHAEVRAVFRISKIGQIAGCYVRDGEIRRNARIRVKRGEEIVHEGAISSLKHLQEDEKEIRQGFECGIGIKGFDHFQVGDNLECFLIEKAVLSKEPFN